jgi:4-hydroxy-tetrahydrodipicolinate reductase
MKLAIHGATGRMGLSVARLAVVAPEVSIVGAICSSVDPEQGRDLGELAGVGPLGVQARADLGAGLLGAEVVIDFSVASAVPGLMALAARHKVAVVTGTTNLDSAGRQALDKAAELVPVLWAPNMSLGVEVLAEVVKLALARLGSEYDVEIVEAHHRRKVDAPSGTALRLLDAVREGRSGIQPLHGRQGEVGQRTEEEVAVLSIRGGDVIGDHTVHLLGPGERLELTHRATSRELFAHGALKAASFLYRRKPGLYTIADVLRG